MRVSRREMASEPHTLRPPAAPSVDLRRRHLVGPFARLAFPRREVQTAGPDRSLRRRLLLPRRTADRRNRRRAARLADALRRRPHACAGERRLQRPALRQRGLAQRPRRRAAKDTRGTAPAVRLKSPSPLPLSRTGEGARPLSERQRRSASARFQSRRRHFAREPRGAGAFSREGLTVKPRVKFRQAMSSRGKPRQGRSLYEINGLRRAKGGLGDGRVGRVRRRVAVALPARAVAGGEGEAETRWSSVDSF